MSRSKSSVLFVAVILCSLALTMTATPARAFGPADGDGVRAGSLFDFSIAAWVDQLLDRWLGDEDRMTADQGPETLYDRAGVAIDPNGAYQTGTELEGDRTTEDSSAGAP